MTKVLIFESDPEFAGELRTELGRLGCTVHIVEDGNVGLTAAVQERPDLILLSIELPRMNGFSVCNKLKKDGALKDIPLLIMSSESSEETFEQHKKLRTRAEDYVHKPIAFGELLEHIRRYVKIEGGEVEAGDGIVIDDAALVIEDIPDSVEPEPTIMTSDLPGLDAARQAAAAAAPAAAPAGPSTVPAAPPSPAAPARPVLVAGRPKKQDLEIDEFIGGAFDRLLGEDDEATVVKPLHTIHPELSALQHPGAGPTVPAPPPAAARGVVSVGPPGPAASSVPAPRPSEGGLLARVDLRAQGAAAEQAGRAPLHVARPAGAAGSPAPRPTPQAVAGRTVTGSPAVGGAGAAPAPRPTPPVVTGKAPEGAASPAPAGQVGAARESEAHRLRAEASLK